MSFPDFIPLEYRGMSILTATFFFFAGIGLCYFHSIIRREFGYIYSTLEEHENKLNEIHDTLGSMRTDIALLLQSVTKIEKILEQK